MPRHRQQTRRPWPCVRSVRYVCETAWGNTWRDNMHISPRDDCRRWKPIPDTPLLFVLEIKCTYPSCFSVMGCLSNSTRPCLSTTNRVERRTTQSSRPIFSTKERGCKRGTMCLRNDPDEVFNRQSVCPP